MVYISKANLEKEVHHISKGYMVAYQDIAMARRHPNGFLEGHLSSFSDMLTRNSIRNELLKPGTGYVVLEHHNEFIGQDIIFVRIITDDGFVGWVLSAEPLHPELDEADW